MEGDTRLCGLIVMEEYAQRFVNGPSGERKTMELRKTDFTKYLSEGERILLISCAGRNGPRRVLAILEYQDGFRIKNTMINQFYSAHRISAQELTDAFGGWMDTQDHCFGLCFSLVHVFDDPIVLAGKQSSRIWSWLSCENLTFGGAHGLRLTRTGTNSSMETTLSSASVPSENVLSTAMSSTDSKCDSAEPSGSRDQLKRTYTDMVEDSEQGDAPTDAEQNAMDTALIQHDDSKFLCLCITDTEWFKLRNGESCFLYRSFPAQAATNMIVLIHSLQGYVVVGELTIADSSDHTSIVKACGKSQLADHCQQMYSQEVVGKLKYNKSTWLWRISAVNVFDTPHTCKFLDVAPRFKNRPFYMAKETLAPATPKSIPKRLHLFDTGKFFVDSFSDEHKQALFALLRGLNKQVIRVGTTCSGTDVCIKALQELVNVFNEMEDCIGYFFI